MEHEDPMVARMRAESAIASARTTLLVVGILGVIGIGLVYLPALSEVGAALFDFPGVILSLVVDVALVSTYFVCRFVAVKNPAPALAVALAVFCLGWLISIFFADRPWHAGILVRGIVLYFLVKGFMATRGVGRSHVNPDVFE